MVRETKPSCRGTSTYHLGSQNTALHWAFMLRNKFKPFSHQPDKGILNLEVQIHALWCKSAEPKRGRLRAIFSKNTFLSVTFPLEFL